ncbi:MAG: NtaA/DmoA family FMN-dependent monooxygenase [Streptosporangiaceae bacterium]|nr:NtaA/DmoA family FMN-dependent monooxygenase [Streptosporangiaceae bacterium]
MHVNVLTQCIPAPLFEGMWRHPDDQTATGYRSFEYWISIARQLEESCIDALFFADIHGVYDTYHGSIGPSVRHSVQIPAIDPVLVIPAAAAATRHLGFAVTYSTSYHAPYQCARVFSTLDHLTNGRIGWNIVTSDLRLARATGLSADIPHDERYDRADEYLDVVVRLWEDSWEDGAVVLDRESDSFADPARVHRVEHAGRWFTLSAPHQAEPSPQRTPVLYQAGASSRGRSFAARHAEVVFVTLSGFRQGRELVTDLRHRAAAAGRDPSRLKVLQGMCLIVAEDGEQARARAADYLRLSSKGGLIAKWCGWSGVDLAAYAEDTPVSALRAQDLHSVIEFVEQASGKLDPTVGDLRDFVATPQRPHPYTRLMLYGTPEQVADRMVEWIERTGVDGFNLMPCPPTRGMRDMCELLVPELQRRGLLRKQYDAAEPTLRERYFGTGNARYTRS